MKTNQMKYNDARQGMTCLLLLCLLLASCKKFLDIKKSSDQFLLATAEDCQLMLDNYTKMNTGYPIDGEVSSDDYYITGSAYQTSTTIPQEEKELYTWNAGAQRISSEQNWLAPYQAVYNANLVLETLEKLKGGSEDPVLLNALRGSALFYRAYCFWNVAQLYTRPYNIATAAQDPGIPLRLDADINGKSARGTVQDTYNRILQDLNEAVSLLPNTSGIATRPTKAAAYAMLARTCLSMEDYPNALINANACLQIKGTLLDYNSSAVNKSLSSNTPFARFNDEVIFHAITYNKASAPVGGAILAPGTASSNTAKIDPALAASYATNDLRSIVFVKRNSGAHTGTFRFTGNYERAATAAFFTGLAVDEIYLIRAECYARAGNTDAAMQALNTLLSNRWMTGTYVNMTAATAEEALTRVLEERRKELLMRGLRWMDLRRLKKSISRSLTIDGVTTEYTLPAGDARYTLLLPKEVIENAKIAQNSR